MAAVKHNRIWLRVRSTLIIRCPGQCNFWCCVRKQVLVPGSCWSQERAHCSAKNQIWTCFRQGLQQGYTPNVAAVCRVLFTMAMTVMYNGIQFAPVSTKRSIVVPFQAEVVWSVVGKFGRQAVWMGSVEGQRIFTQLLVGYRAVRTSLLVVAFRTYLCAPPVQHLLRSFALCS